MERHGSVATLIPGRRALYIELHRQVWPAVQQAITRVGITNHSIYVIDHTLYRYYEYEGLEHEAALRELEADPAVVNWLAATDRCQVDLGDGQRWREMESVCFLP